MFAFNKPNNPDRYELNYDSMGIDLGAEYFKTGIKRKDIYSSIVKYSAYGVSVVNNYIFIRNDFIYIGDKALRKFKHLINFDYFDYFDYLIAYLDNEYLTRLGYFNEFNINTDKIYLLDIITKALNRHIKLMINKCFEYNSEFLKQYNYKISKITINMGKTNKDIINIINNAINNNEYISEIRIINIINDAISTLVYYLYTNTISISKVSVYKYIYVINIGSNITNIKIFKIDYNDNLYIIKEKDDQRLNGRIIDYLIYKHIIKLLRKNNIDELSIQQYKYYILLKCEKFKHGLSKSDNIDIDLNMFPDFKKKKNEYTSEEIDKLFLKRIDPGNEGYNDYIKYTYRMTPEEQKEYYYNFINNEVFNLSVYYKLSRNDLNNLIEEYLNEYFNLNITSFFNDLLSFNDLNNDFIELVITGGGLIELPLFKNNIINYFNGIDVIFNEGENNMLNSVKGSIIYNLLIHEEQLLKVIPNKYNINDLLSEMMEKEKKRDESLQNYILQNIIDINIPEVKLKKFNKDVNGIYLYYLDNELNTKMNRLGAAYPGEPTANIPTIKIIKLLNKNGYVNEAIQEVSLVGDKISTIYIPVI